MAELTDPIRREYDLAIQLPTFEGPLDLLLYLIRKEELDIYDIPIARVTQQYLEILGGLEEHRLEVAGEFFVMAATLMQIKSRLLLPREAQTGGIVEEAEEAVDPRWELVQQLLEYRKFRDAAEELQGRFLATASAAQREITEQLEPDSLRPLQPSDRLELWTTFNVVLRRLSDRIAVGRIEDEPVTVAECMERVLSKLGEGCRLSLSDLIPEGELSSQFLVATFLALLELARVGEVELEQDDQFGDIICARIRNPVETGTEKGREPGTADEWAGAELLGDDGLEVLESF